MEPIAAPLDSQNARPVLVVDDEPSSRRLVGTVLRRDGLAVETAESGEEAIEQLQALEYDLVVADWRMPGLDGSEFVGAIRRLPDGGPYLIVLTNLAGEHALVDALDAGADDYVPKSAGRAELLARVRVGIRMREVRRAAAEARRERDRSEDLATRLGRTRAELEERNRDLERERGILQVVLDTTPVGVRLVDADEHVLVVNRAFEEGLGQHCVLNARTERDRVIALATMIEDPARFLSMLDRTDATPNLTSSDEYVLALSGRSFTRYTTPVHDLDGDQIGRLFVHHETTAERQAERLKDEFVAVASHLLRTPLTSVRGYLDLLREEEEASGLSTRQRYLLDVAARNAERLSALVSDVILFAEVEARQLQIAPGMCDAVRICAEAVEAVSLAAADSAVTIQMSVPEAVPLEADPIRVRQILDNLLSNAVKFTPSGGQVTLIAESAGDRVRLVVGDTGIGIPEDERDQLFGRFFRGRLATERQIPGTGLGLAITHGLVHAHGGTIVCESREGHGARFTVELPVNPADPRNDWRADRSTSTEAA